MSSRPIHLNFDQKTYPDPNIRFIAWQDAMSLSVDTSIHASRVENFEASLSFYPFGPVVVADASFKAHAMARTKATIFRSGEEHIICDVFPKGGLQGVFDGKYLSINTGDCLFLDLKQTFWAEVTDGQFIGLIMPRAVFQAHSPEKPAIHGLHLSAGGAEAGIIGPLLVSAAAQAPRLSPSRRDALGAEIVGIVIASIGHERHARARDTTTVSIASLAHIHRYIDHHASNPGLSPHHLCEVFSLSRSMLYRIFASDGGIANVIRAKRADVALRLLGKSPAGVSIDTIAIASGFSNARALHRALQEFHNMNPSQIRKHSAAQSTDHYKHSVDIAKLLDRMD